MALQVGLTDRGEAALAGFHDHLIVRRGHAGRPQEVLELAQPPFARGFWLTLGRHAVHLDQGLIDRQRVHDAHRRG
jgi:hypothetical protein